MYNTGYRQQAYQSPPLAHGPDPRYGHPRQAPDAYGYQQPQDEDRSGSITVTELQSALVNGNWTNTVKMLMSIFDTDRSGTISFTEFAGLWKYISDWQNVFRHFDRDRSGSIEGRELSEALKSFGYNLSPQLLTLIEQKYSSEPVSGYGPPPGITFDRFVRACVVVKTLTEAFQRVDTDRDGWIQISYDQFMQVILKKFLLLHGRRIELIPG
ncbi:hypothetical protein BDZ97DRAFT_171562 [Flammula alnicola]|nr:hypothetical protein BDZ97DRAFT_171562 [Flammula alnicola]